MLEDLKGKTAIVTGSAGGIGQAIAVSLAKHGCNVVVSDIMLGKSTINKIKKTKGKAIYIKADVTKKTDIENLFKQAKSKFKKIDILVNNAGIFIPAPTSKAKEQDWDKTMQVNLKGYFLCSQQALKYLKKGSIINISSVAGIMGYPQAAAYSSSKGGVRLLTKSLAVELGPKIRVNSVHPGIIETAMTKEILKDKKTKKGMLSQIPLSRIGKPEDIAKAVTFLASDSSSYITGEELIIDGGWTCHL